MRIFRLLIISALVTGSCLLAGGSVAQEMSQEQCFNLLNACLLYGGPASESADTQTQESNFIECSMHSDLEVDSWCTAECDDCGCRVQSTQRITSYSEKLVCEIQVQPVRGWVVTVPPDQALCPAVPERAVIGAGTFTQVIPTFKCIKKTTITTESCSLAFACDDTFADELAAEE